MSEPFIRYQPCVLYSTDEHSSLLDWVRDENNAEYQPLELSPATPGIQTANLFYETAGRLFTCPGNAVYAAKGNPFKVRRCYIIFDDLVDDCHQRDCLYPPNWLDQPGVIEK